MKAAFKVALVAPIYLPFLSKYLDSSPGFTFQGMGGSCVTYLADALLSEGAQLSIHTLDPSLSRPCILKGDHLTIYAGPYRPSGRMCDLMRKERTVLLESLKIDQPDVVHAHWTYEYAHAAIKSEMPHIITVHDWAPAILMYHKDLYRLGRYLMDRIAMRKGLKFTVNSPYLQEKVSRVTNKKVPITPNAIPDQWFLHEAKCKSASFRILSINNGFRGRKNVSRLIEAFGHVREAYPDARLTLIGNCYEPNGEAFVWAKANGLSGNISFRGALSNSEIKDSLDESDLLVHPALEESFGMTLVEAMARRVPVVGGLSSGAVPWVLDDGRAGKLVDVSDARAIANGILELLCDDRVWTKFSLSGYQHTQKVFNATHVSRELLKLYKNSASC
jgi:glycosyltransferase involved in cell wall biosynthesis